MNDSVVVIDTGSEFEIFLASNLLDISGSVSPDVFETVLNLAMELSTQGRDGKSVGTIFVLGDEEKVLQLSRQLIINPFKGYSEEELSLHDPQFREAVKEFSVIDGAFIVRGDGILITAGRHLNAALEGDNLPQGLGSRHVAAAGITSLTDAIAIVISESTGSVRIFKSGKIFMEIEKPAAKS
jgi:DNA integrity scanning protein DisA with diadenylate cyclase activity